MDEDRDLEIVELDNEELDENAYSAGRLLSVATLGALLSLGAYYLYQQMDEEKKISLRRKASNMVADQIGRLTEIED